MKVENILGRHTKRNAISTAVAVVVIIVILVVALGGYYAYSSASSSSSTTTTTTTSSKPAPTITIAAVFPLTGSSSYFGTTCLQAAQLAAQDINNAGGITALGGAKIKILSVDTTSDATQAYSVVQSLLSTNKNITAAVGAYASGLTIPLLPLFQQYQVPLIHTAFSNLATTNSYTYGFRIAPNATTFGDSMVNFLVYLGTQGFDVSRIALVYENDAYGAGVAQAVQAALQQYPQYHVVLNEPYSLSGFTNAQPVVTAVQAANPQLIMEVSYLNDASLIVQGLRAQGLNIPIIGGSGGFPLQQLYKQVGNDTNLIFTAAAYNANESKLIAQSVNSEYQAKYGYFMPEAAGSYYSAVWTIADAINQAASTNPVVIDQTLHSMTVTSGNALILPEDQIHFNSIGANVDAFPVIAQWQNGKLLTVYPLNLATAKPILPPVPP
ncbi:MAG: ABC transporter substrate-binding protein [Nitrososphaerota archaeon]|nr:ABC transporter substrate-binding protein [Nitrososphaerota archaeon]